MKRIYFLLMVLMVAVTGWSQTTYYWQPGAGGNWTTASNWNTNPVGGGATRGTPQASDILIFDKGTTMTINSIPSQTIGRLSILSGSVTLTAGGGPAQTLTIGGSTGDDFIVAAGATLTQASSLENISLAASSVARISGTYIANQNFNNSAASSNTTVEVGGVLQITNTFDFSGNGATATINGSLNLGNGADFSFNMGGNSVATINGSLNSSTGSDISNETAGRLLFPSGSTYRHTLNGNEIPFATWNANSLVLIEGVTNSAPGNLNQTFGNLTWNCTSQNATVSLAASLGNVTNTFTLQSTNNQILRLKNSGGGITSDQVHNYTQTGGTLQVLGDDNGHELRINGNFNMSGGTLTRGGTADEAEVIFNGTTEQTFTKTGGTISGSVNFVLNGNSIVNFGTSQVTGTGDFIVNSGAKIITSSAAGLNNSGTTGTIATTAGARTFSSTADYEFRGALTGNFTTSGNNVRNLTFNNAANISTQRAFIVNGALSLIAGYVTPGGGTLTVSTTGTINATVDAYVNGPLSKQTAASGVNFTFHVGKPAGGGKHTIAIATTTANNSTFTAEYFRASPKSIANGTVMGSGIEMVNDCEYHTIGRTGTASANVTLSWNAASNCAAPQTYVGELSSLRLARHNGTGWQSISGAGGADMGSTLATGTVSSNVAQTAFTQFALATSNAAENPLPVLFADVKAYAKNDGVQVEWSNLTEREILFYEVERSANGVDFTAINNQLPKRNLDDKASYTYFDATPLKGSNFYRIRVKETSGKVIYSKILRVETDNSRKAFGLYPNPVVGKQMTITLNGVQAGKYNFSVVNATGQVVYRTIITNAANGVTQQIDLPASLKAGMYTGLINGDNYQESKLFIVQ